jgi:hypothetical protein
MLFEVMIPVLVLIVIIAVFEMSIEHHDPATPLDKSAAALHERESNRESN